MYAVELSWGCAILLEQKPSSADQPLLLISKELVLIFEEGFRVIQCPTNLGVGKAMTCLPIYSKKHFSPEGPAFEVRIMNEFGSGNGKSSRMIAAERQ
jgi:hypothetical protein